MRKVRVASDVLTCWRSALEVTFLFSFTSSTHFQSPEDQRRRDGLSCVIVNLAGSSSWAKRAWPAPALLSSCACRYSSREWYQTMDFTKGGLRRRKIALPVHSQWGGKQGQRKGKEPTLKKTPTNKMKTEGKRSKQKRSEKGFLGFLWLQEPCY